MSDVRMRVWCGIQPWKEAECHLLTSLTSLTPRLPQTNN